MAKSILKGAAKAEAKDVGSDDTVSTTTTTKKTPSSKIQFRVFVGSYEHNLLCLSVLLDPTQKSEAMFQPIFHFEAHSLAIKSIDLAKRYLVTGSKDEHIRIYDLQKRKELGDLMGHQGTVTALKFSMEGTEDDVEKSGKWLLSGSEDGKILIWRTKDWELFGTLKGHTDRVTDVAIHPSGRVAISVSADHTIRLWNLLTAKKAAVLKIKGKDHLGQYGDFVRWSASGDNFIVGLQNQLLIYATTEAKIIHKMKIPRTLMCGQVYTIEGTEYFVAGLGNGTIQFYLLSDLIEGKETVAFELVGHANRIKDLTLFSGPEDTQGIPYLISVSSDGRLVVWDLRESVRDQVAVYDTGERLNCVVACAESVEKASTMKKRTQEIDYQSESEYESDGETRKLMVGKKKKGKKMRKVTVTRE
ncbi:hypothetical protein DIURU_001120 [Diutina rugosa]|uniref:Anaphase-promoting complex subunit 4 WD40 domain-containing protein n=1 Tax=Diutina rugosa TaxID=5481 RepID=A0A642UVY4_DIURU|nr:uncharacterized protein DIURU_001120 [Diutina rugosa]KAA8906382.1 hypothetical protein DIURU_001120 [Diutina rugosa]